MKIKDFFIFVFFMMIFLASPAGVARSFLGSLGKTAINKIIRGETKTIANKNAMKKALNTDLHRDALTIAKPLEKPRTVYRYTSKAQAAKEAQFGIISGKHGVHTTSIANPGRPLSAEVAQKRYGLLNKPQVRETIQLPQGFPVKKNKALGGEAGYGEFNSPKHIPAHAIREVKALQ